MLAGELLGHVIEGADALDRDEERLVRRQTRRIEIGHLVAQVRFELVGVTVVDAGALLDERAPRTDLLLHVGHGHALPKARGGSSPPQASASARATVVHCRRCSVERGSTVVGDRVVPAPAAFRWRPPLRGHVAEPVQAVEQRVEHPVGPLHLAVGQLTDPLQDRVPVALAVGQDR